MTIFELSDALQAEGWRLYNGSFGRHPYLAKRFPGHRSCQCNADKPGISVVVNLHQMNIHGNDWQSVEVDVTGEYMNQWYKFGAYSLNPQEFYDDRHNICDRLLAAWDNLA